MPFIIVKYMRHLTVVLIFAALAAPSVDSFAADAVTSSKWLPASPEKLPRWRDFNLLEKFLLQGGRKPFREEDFRLICKLGFNFVRLPMDYRQWIKDRDWKKFDETTLAEIDQAVAWGGKYGIHVCINFHLRAGYTVANPPERTSLWTDAESATRLRQALGDVRPTLSRHPQHAAELQPGERAEQRRSGSVCSGCAKLVEAIRKQDPQRLIIADGVQWGNVPVFGAGRYAHRAGDAGLYARGDQSLQGKLGAWRELSAAAVAARAAAQWHVVKSRETGRLVSTGR